VGVGPLQQLDVRPDRRDLGWIRDSQRRAAGARLASTSRTIGPAAAIGA
jgi:hypothetical protein